MTKVCTCLCVSWHSQHCCLVQQACQPNNGNDNDISTAARRRFSSSSLCHGCSSCVRCCCATIHGKRAIGTCTGRTTGLQVKSWVEHWPLTIFNMIFCFLATDPHILRVVMGTPSLAAWHNQHSSRNAGFRPKAWAWPRKLCKGNCRTGRCTTGELGESISYILYESSLSDSWLMERSVQGSEPHISLKLICSDSDLVDHKDFVDSVQ